MKENSREDIKILEEFIEGLKQYNPKTGKDIKPTQFGEGQRYVYSNVYYAIEHILSDYKRVLKENEELRQERELVGLPVRNKRDGKIGIILHQWKSGSVAVLENIKPRVINTHDDWNTLEIINDNVEQKRTKNDYIPIILDNSEED